MTVTTMTDTTTTSKRPLAITLICILSVIGFIFAIGAVVALAFLPAEATRQVTGTLPPWQLPYSVVSFIIGLASIVGLWQMRRWGVFAYAAITVIEQATQLIAGTWGVTNLIIPVIVLAVCGVYFKRMR